MSKWQKFSLFVFYLLFISLIAIFIALPLIGLISIYFAILAIAGIIGFGFTSYRHYQIKQMLITKFGKTPKLTKEEKKAQKLNKKLSTYNNIAQQRIEILKNQTKQDEVLLGVYTKNISSLSGIRVKLIKEDTNSFNKYQAKINKKITKLTNTINKKRPVHTAVTSTFFSKKMAKKVNVVNNRLVYNNLKADELKEKIKQEAELKRQNRSRPIYQVNSGTDYKKTVILDANILINANKELKKEQKENRKIIKKY